MEITLVPSDRIDRPAYEELLAACPWSTVFHSLEWMPIYTLFSPASSQLLLCAGEGGRLDAAMPVTVFRRLGVRAVFSSGFSLYGGPIARPGCPGSVLDALLRRFGRDFRGPRTLLCVVHDLAGVCGSLEEEGFTRSTATTHVMALPESREALESSLERNVRYPIARAAREGVAIARSTDPEDFARWTRLCVRSYRAHGRRPYPKELFRAVARRLRESPALRFYPAKREGGVVGGVVLFVSGGQAFYWMSATDAEHLRLGVNPATLYATLCDAIDEGVRAVDFGVTPEGSGGVAYFKDKWGMTARRYPVYERSRLPGRLAAMWMRYGRGVLRKVRTPRRESGSGAEAQGRTEAR